MKNPSVQLVRSFGLALLLTLGGSAFAAPDFHSDVAPILREYCAGCHNNDDLDGELSVETFGALMKGGESGKAVTEAACGYLNLELDLETGKRSSRQLAIREWVCRLTGAESATAVNNNAAATIIALRAIAAGKEVILSRGQLIEIGGSFRIPEIMSVSGAVLREVGTTNITRLSDYEDAIGPETGALLQIHTSNYRIRGFTKSVPLEDLVELGRKHNLPVIDDTGSGALIDFSQFGFDDEPDVTDSIKAGADLVLFSGDKLLGGPQAGIIAGKEKWIKKIEKDPFMRAFRLDKMVLAALETTLRLYLDPETVKERVPVLRMLDIPLAELQQRCERFAEQLSNMDGILSATVMEDQSFVGGGSLPDQALPTFVIAVQVSPEKLTRITYLLRTGEPAVMCRVKDDRMLFDLRTVFPHQEGALLSAIRQTLADG